MTTYLNLNDRIAYEADPQVGGGLYSWPVYLGFSGNDDPLLVMLLARVRAQMAERTARDGPRDILV